MFPASVCLGKIEIKRNTDQSQDANWIPDEKW